MPGRNDLGTETDNLLLAALPKKDYKRLLKKMRQVPLKQGERLIVPGQPVRDAYFPINAMISLVSLMEEGQTVETGVVGNEGLLGIPILLGMKSTPMESVVQIPGTAWKMPARRLKEEFDAGGALNKILLRYLHVLFVEVSQTAACNKLHSIDGRLARWLLMGSDSTRSEDLPLTHEFLSLMLGVRRAGVSEAASRLRRKGLIRYHHGLVTILDRSGLEKVACECYRIVKREFDLIKN